jgi:hypothetical protein
VERGNRGVVWCLWYGDRVVLTRRELLILRRLVDGVLKILEIDGCELRETLHVDLHVVLIRVGSEDVLDVQKIHVEIVAVQLGQCGALNQIRLVNLKDVILVHVERSRLVGTVRVCRVHHGTNAIPHQRSASLLIAKAGVVLVIYHHRQLILFGILADGTER